MAATDRDLFSCPPAAWNSHSSQPSLRAQCKCPSLFRKQVRPFTVTGSQVSQQQPVPDNLVSPGDSPSLPSRTSQGLYFRYTAHLGRAGCVRFRCSPRALPRVCSCLSHHVLLPGPSPTYLSSCHKERGEREAESFTVIQGLHSRSGVLKADVPWKVSHSRHTAGAGVTEHTTSSCAVLSPNKAPLPTTYCTYKTLSCLPLPRLREHHRTGDRKKVRARGWGGGPLKHWLLGRKRFLCF